MIPEGVIHISMHYMVLEDLYYTQIKDAQRRSRELYEKYGLVNYVSDSNDRYRIVLGYFTKLGNAVRMVSRLKSSQMNLDVFIEEVLPQAKETKSIKNMCDLELLREYVKYANMETSDETYEAYKKIQTELLNRMGGRNAESNPSAL